MWRLLLACTPDPGTEPERSDYATHAAPTLQTHCTACHGALRAEGGLRLDTHTLASLAGARALVRMEEGSMPPGGGVRGGEIAAFALWVEQGMPGEDVARPEGELLPGGLGSLEVNAAVEELSPGRFEVVWVEALSGAPFAREVWLAQEGGIALELRAREEVEDRWDPALRIFDPGRSSWTQDTEHSRSGALGEDAWLERWTGRSWDVLDARAYDKEAIGSWIVEEGGAEEGLQAGERYLVGRSSLDPELGYTQSLLVRTEALPQALLEDGLQWTERVILWP